jgi:hypothetical protein
MFGGPRFITASDVFLETRLDRRLVAFSGRFRGDSLDTHQRCSWAAMDDRFSIGSVNHVFNPPCHEMQVIAEALAVNVAKAAVKFLSPFVTRTPATTGYLTPKPTTTKMAEALKSLGK